MAAISAKNTKPEIIVRKGLHHRGFRYRLHDRALPGTPDIVLKRYRAIIDVRGWFFDGHDCSLFKLPETRREFWRKKIWANVDRDRRNLIEQRDLGWRTAIVWECALRGPGRLDISFLFDQLEEWLASDIKFEEFRGWNTHLQH